MNLQRKEAFDIEASPRLRRGGRYRNIRITTSFLPDDPADAVFYIPDGHCKITVVAEGLAGNTSRFKSKRKMPRFLARARPLKAPSCAELVTPSCQSLGC